MKLSTFPCGLMSPFTNVWCRLIGVQQKQHGCDLHVHQASASLMSLEQLDTISEPSSTSFFFVNIRKVHVYSCAITPRVHNLQFCSPIDL